ncbi:hypothetical protein GU3_08560 [Oceanimonas sp. GK1]|uniref:hypothetical protein n=1 Tax=Oceanimonas sp. (strain GK1 / IBRC-M 10197) TaxID=511062 RepID=UPI0002495375|nr:hypothetical protein [Oceanimonas sp. GK1]AEY01468.1 hypothetical protein GU3_08560 [Oceanimonas sp. GK1]
MSWSQRTLTWPPSAASIETAAGSVLAGLPAAQQQAVSALSSAAGAVNFKPHALSAEAAGLLQLRDQLNQWLVSGQRLTVTPYDHDVGSREESGHYLAPGNAAKRLADKLQDSADPHRPQGQLQVLGLLVTAATLGEFANALESLTRVLPIPELCTCARRARARAELQHAQTRMQTPTTGITPKWVPGRHNVAPLRPTAAALGAQLAQLESLAGDAQSPVAKLTALAAKRAGWISQQQQALAELKAGLNGSLYALQASGTPATVAASLTGGLPGYERAHTAAVLLASDQPLTFFKELLP